LQVNFTFSRPYVKQEDFWQIHIIMHIPLKAKGGKIILNHYVSARYLN